jgi:hypothetical protein
MTGAVSSGLGVIPVECEYVVRTEENKERRREAERDRAERGKERQRAVQIIHELTSHGLATLQGWSKIGGRRAWAGLAQSPLEAGQ